MDGSYEPVQEIGAALDRLQAETALDIPIHADAASDGFSFDLADAFSNRTKNARDHLSGASTTSSRLIGNANTKDCHYAIRRLPQGLRHQLEVCYRS